MTSERKRSNQSGTSGASTRDSGQRPKCFRDILDVVLRLTDEEWRAVSRDMPREVSRLEFAAACTKVVTSVSSAVVRRLLKPLCKSFGIKAILEANNRLKNMESQSDASDASTESSQASEFICHLGQRIVTEIKDAMLEAIQRTASQAKSPADVALSQLEDLSVSCTNDICENILSLYHSEKLHRPGKKTSETSLKSHQEVHGIMKSLGQVVSISRSSSCCSLSSASDLILTRTEVKAPNSTSSAAQAERPFSDQFMSKASQVISDVLLKTEQKLAASMLAQTAVPVCSETELKFMTELANSTAAEILQKLFYILVQSLREHLYVVGPSDAKQSGAECEQKFLSEAQKIHTGIRKQVFRFFRKRQQAVSEKSQTLLDVCPEASAERGVKVQEPNNDKQFLNRATRVASDVLVKRLNSHISTGSISMRHSGSGAPQPSKVVSDNVNKLVGEKAPEIRRSDVEMGSEKKPSVQKNIFSPLHLLTVVRNHMKAFVSSFKRSADDKKVDTSLAQEPKKHHIGCSLSDSVLERRNRTLHAIQFPSELIYTFVEESTKGLLQNVLNKSSSDGKGDGRARHTAEAQEKNKTSRTRYVVKADRRLVVKNFNSPKKQKKRNGVPPSHRDKPNTSTSAHLHSSSNRRSDASPSVFRNTPRTLSKFFSVSQTPSRPSPSGGAMGVHPAPTVYQPTRRLIK